VPAELRHLPWECLYEEARGFGFLLNDPRYGLVRDAPAVETREIAARPSLPLRMLVVIPQGSQLNVEKELHGLDLADSCRENRPSRRAVPRRCRSCRR
jgi:hypothetical protein